MESAGICGTRPTGKKTSHHALKPVMPVCYYGGDNNPPSHNSADKKRKARNGGPANTETWADTLSEEIAMCSQANQLENIWITLIN
jgi:hypothetical protein